jgi:hypothetical protein
LRGNVDGAGEGVPFDVELDSDAQGTSGNLDAALPVAGVGFGVLSLVLRLHRQAQQQEEGGEALQCRHDVSFHS